MHYVSLNYTKSFNPFRPGKKKETSGMKSDKSLKILNRKMEHEYFDSAFIMIIAMPTGNKLNLPNKNATNTFVPDITCFFRVSSQWTHDKTEGK